MIIPIIIINITSLLVSLYEICIMLRCLSPAPFPLGCGYQGKFIAVKVMTANSQKSKVQCIYTCPETLMRVWLVRNLFICYIASSRSWLVELPKRRIREKGRLVLQCSDELMILKGYELLRVVYRRTEKQCDPGISFTWTYQSTGGDRAVPSDVSSTRQFHNGP